jgi:two-component system, cell cycle sensor histidine kinase and response regulator CckA
MPQPFFVRGDRTSEAMYRILIADNDESSREALTRTISGLGYELAGSARDGSAAVRLAGELRPDLVLMDIVMSGDSDGIAAAGTIHKEFDIPVVFMTGSASADSAVKAAGADAYGYLVKPFPEEALGGVIEIAVRKHSEMRRLADGNKFFRIFNNAPLAMAMSTVGDGTFIDVNEKFIQVTGYGREVVVGKTTAALGWMSGKVRGRIAAGIKSRGRVESLELYVTTKNGKQLCFLYSGEVIEIDGSPLILSIAQDITDRKKMETALRDAETKFRTVADNTYDWEFWIDEQGRFLYNSPSCLHVTGYGAAEFRKDPQLFFRIIHSDDRELFRLHILEAGARSMAEGIDFRINHKDGSVRWIALVCQPVRDRDGAYLGIRGSNRDVTDRKRLEEEWRKSDFIINAAGEFITMINRRYVYELVSDSYCRAMARSRQEVVGRTVGEIWGEERFRNVIKGKLDRCFAGGAVSDQDWLDLPNAGRRYFHIHYYPYAEPGGGTTHAIVISHDVTELKQAELGLSEAEKNYRDIVEHAEEGIFRTAPDGRFLMANKAIAAMLGYNSPEELLNAAADISKRMYVRPEDRDEALRTIGEEGAVRGYETELFRKDGSRIWISMNMRAVHDAGGNLVCYEGINQDVTARKQADEDRLRIEAQLLQSQKLETIGRLAAGMAHDFNNLIAPIRGFAEIMMEECTPGDPHQDDLKQIKLAAEMAGNLTRQLLAFGSKQILSLKPVDMRQVVRGVEKLLRRTVREDIDIRIKVPKSLKKVNADISQIEQIIVNLAVNAQDAMPGKGLFAIELKSIRIDADVPDKDPRAAQGDYVLLSISDTGCGMDQETMEHIFEPFFTTKEKGRGTGLGLSTVYGIIKQHGGFINVYSEVGRGSTLNIYLPCMRGGRDAEMIVPGEEEVVKGGSETLLIAEDNDMVLRMTRRALERIGYRVVAANDPEQCLRMVAAYPDTIHLMLIDVIMPGMNGKELYERLSVLRPDVDVIYMSGYSEDVISHHGVLDAEVNFIQKPFSTRDLARLIRIVLDGKR